MKAIQTTTRQLVCSVLLLAWGLVTSQTLYAQSSYSQPYTFTTLAGNAGYGSDDGVGANARFSNPRGVAVDSMGNVYVADCNNHTIRKITPGGVVSTLAGLAGASGSADGAGSNARFNHPSGVAVDSAGSVYVADTDNSIIRKVTPAGVVSTLAGLAGSLGATDGPGNIARFYNPSGLAVDSAGNVYVADTYNCTIRKVTPAGVVSTWAGSAGIQGSFDGTNRYAQFFKPLGVAVDSAGNAYVADTSNHTIRKITPDGAVSTLAGLAAAQGSDNGTGTNARFNGPSGVAVDSTGNLYVADTSNHTIRTITPDGVVSTLAGLAEAQGSADGAGSNARFNHPSGVAVDSAGNVYVGDTRGLPSSAPNNTIRKITPAGVVSTLAGLAGSYGSAEGTGANARFSLPPGVAVDNAGNVYVADYTNHTIRQITPAGVASTLAGLSGSAGSADGTGANARFYYPSGVAVDSAGNVYVADTYNCTIRRVTAAGEVSTLAGLAGAKGSVDGPGSNARFYNPSGLAVDSAGNVYVADDWNHTLRKITPAGEVSTLAGLAGTSGSADGTGANARFNHPSGVAVDRAGNLYVADALNHTIRQITPAGEVSTLAGLAGTSGSADGTGSNARFYYPDSVAVDSAGNLYVGDTFNQTIRQITPAGEVSTLAGLAGATGSANGTGSNARFYYPRGVAVDGAGNLYVADTYNSTIRFGRVAPAPPLLGIRPAGSQVILSWPLEGSNILVEASSTLIPVPAWLPLTNAVGMDGQSCIVTNSLDTGARFFRLRLP